MAQETDLSPIYTVVDSVLSKQFKDRIIVDIEILKDVDEDGDEVFKILVCFDDSKQSTLDARKASGLVGHLQKGLEAIQETAFPIVSYIGYSEAQNGDILPAT